MIHLSGTTKGGLKSSKQEAVLNTEESAHLSVYHKYSISIFFLFFFHQSQCIGRYTVSLGQKQICYYFPKCHNVTAL